MNTKNVFSALRKSALHYLQANELLNDIAFREVAEGDITTLFNDALKGSIPSVSGKTGVTALINTPRIKTAMNASGGYPRYWAVLPIELVTITLLQPGVDAPAEAWSIYEALMRHTFADLDIQLFVRDGDAPVSPRDSRDAEQKLRRTTMIELSFELPQTKVQKVAKPRITATVDGSILLTMTTPTTGAQIYYTTAPMNTEPVYPTPTTGTLYTGPATFADDIAFAAAAYLTGWYASEMATGAEVVASLPHITTEDGQEITTEGGDIITTET